jgi:hypothetical protein
MHDPAAALPAAGKEEEAKADPRALCMPDAAFECGPIRMVSSNQDSPREL